jgi:hypothetical protein
MIDILQAHEEILWRGRPRQGILLRDLDILAIPMSIMLFGFSLILDFAIIHYHVGFAMLSLAILLNILFLYLGVFRFIVNARRRKKQEYIITNKRVIVSMQKKSGKIYKTLPFRNIEGLDLTSEKDGYGFITFGNINPVLPWLFGGYVLNGNKLYGLELVPNAAEVHKIILAQCQLIIDEELKPHLKIDPKQMN